MSSELLAISAAVFFAAAFVASKRGLVRTSLVTALLLINGAGLVVAAAATLFDPPGTVRGTVLFASAGLISPALGFSAGLVGVHLLGPSIAVPIQQGARPLIAVAGAFLLLGESVDAIEIVGILAIIAGGVGLASQISDERASGPEKVRDRSQMGTNRALAFPITAALAFAAFDVFTKHALAVEGQATYATMVAIGISLVACAVAAAVIPRLRESLAIRTDAAWLLLGGVFFGLAQLSLFHALARGDVSIVSPILATQPLIVFLLSKLLLRGIEAVRPLTVVLGLVVVGGTILLVA